LRFHMNSAKKTRPIAAMIAETMALEMTPLSVNTLKSFDTARRTWFDWKPLNWAVGERLGEVDEEEDIRGEDGVDEVKAGRGVDVGNTVLPKPEV